MARPSQDVDKELLRVGRELYPALGCTGLSVRRVALEAGANPAMVHYHFGSKEGFLRALFDGMYEDMFAGLTHEAAAAGDPLQRLRGALRTLAHFVREHRPFIARVWGDAQAGEAVAQEFARANGPRHLQLLMALTLEAEQAGQLTPAAPLQRLRHVTDAFEEDPIEARDGERRHDVVEEQMADAGRVRDPGRVVVDTSDGQWRAAKAIVTEMTIFASRGIRPRQRP